MLIRFKTAGKVIAAASALVFIASMAAPLSGLSFPGWDWWKYTMTMDGDTWVILGGVLVTGLFCALIEEFWGTIIAGLSGIASYVYMLTRYGMLRVGADGFFDELMRANRYTGAAFYLMLIGSVGK